MCGIAGFIDPKASPEVRSDAVGRMCQAMERRGPDDLGIETLGPATLGMRRLAIFDPANGHQPMRTPDGRHTLVFNGAIYNFQALRADLEAAGRSFRTNCDTEVLLAAYAHWGADALRRLRGMFAFAIWDAEEESLFIARDPFGIKPLYYRHDGERLIFASEIGALLAGRTFEAGIDPSAVADYLGWLAVPAPRTIYRGIFSLRPGECARFHRGRLEVRSYWGFRSIPDDIPVCGSREEFVAQLRLQLDDSIRAHLLADVPVGAFLSGGLDSTVIVGLIKNAGAANLKTFSIGFDESGYSEAAEAKASAKHFDTEHHASILSGREVARDLENILAAFDQPTGDGLNTYYVSQAAHAGGIKVALSGLGGDELFGGYPSFSNLPRMAAWLPIWLRLPRKLRAVIVKRLRHSDTRAHKLADMLKHAHDIHELGSMQRRVFSEPGRRSLLARGLEESLVNADPFHPEVGALRADLAEAGSFEIASAWELRTYMADVLLRDSDVMSMRHSLELRVPFVDRPLIEWLWRQPEKLKYSPKRPKDILADAASDILPSDIRKRRKHGFTLPLAVWMRRELKPFLDHTFSESSVGRSGLFERDTVTALWSGFLQRDDSREWSRLWSLAMLIAFVNRRGSSDQASEPRKEIAWVNPVAPAPEKAPPPAASPKPSTAPEPRKLPPADRKPPAPPPVASAPPASLPAQIKPKRGGRITLLMAPELFSLAGGIPRILQLYLRALSDIAVEKKQGVRMLALNDPMLDTRDIRRSTAAPLDDWLVCSRNKVRFVRGALRMSRNCDRLICGHVAQLPVAWIAKLLHPRLRYFLVAHGIEVWRPFTLAERLALRGARGIFCVSDYTRRELLSHCRLKPSRVVVLPNALDPFFEISAGEPPASCPPVIVTVTRLNFSDRYKGVEHLIAAMPAILQAEPAARLRVIGGGDDLPRLQSVARQYNVLNTSVEFLGFIDDRRLSEELKACRLFALTSRKEGFGLVFLEAMAHGRPCLGARAGGVPEVITEDTGILVPFGDVPAIAAGCIEGLRRNWNQEAMLDRARKFSYQPFKQRLAELLES